MAFTDSNSAIEAYFWVAIEGIRYRFGSIPAADISWNPADTGTNQHILPYLLSNETVQLGGQEVDPLNGENNPRSHSVTIMDIDDVITQLVTVSDSAYVRSYLTHDLSAASTIVGVSDSSGFSVAGGDVFIDRETITYTTTATSTAADAAEDYAAGRVNDALYDAWTIKDAGSTETTEGFFVGSVLTVTAGTNNGQSRTVTSYYHDGTRGVFAFDSRMPAANDNTTTFTLSTPPNLLRATRGGEAAGYWTGALVESTSGNNNGISAWVQSWDGVSLFTLVNPFPYSMLAGDTFNVTRHRLIGCTRGQYSDTGGVEHKVKDQNEQFRKKLVTTKPPFINTRKITIYENRKGEVEANALATVGFIDNFTLTNDLTCYEFSISGVTKLLTKDVLPAQATGRLEFLPLWGGGLEFTTTPLYEDGVTIDRIDAVTITESDSAGNVSTDRIYVDKETDLPTAGANIRINEEIIRYDSIESGYVISEDVGRRQKFLRLYSGAQTYAHINQPTANMEYWLNWGILAKRGLFGNKIGSENLPLSWRHQLVDKKGEAKKTEEIDLVYKFTVQEHAIDSDIAQVLMCDASDWSDFLRRDHISYTAGVGSFAAGDYITGTTSNATGTVVKTETENSVLYVQVVADSDTEFEDAENIQTAGAAKTGTNIVVTTEMRPRNNPIDAWLQMVLSTSGDTRSLGDNGAYDTLPNGLGLGVDESLVDVSLIERLRDDYLGGLEISFIISEPISFDEWARDNIYKLLQIFPYETEEGKIALGRIMTLVEAQEWDTEFTAVSFDSAKKAGYRFPAWSGGHDPITKIEIEYNKHPAADDYLGKANIYFNDANKWFNNQGRTLEFSASSFYNSENSLKNIQHDDTRLPPILKRFIALIWDRYARYPAPIVTLETGYNDLQSNVGDIIKLTDTNIPNMRLSTRSMVDELFQIIGKTPNYTESTMQWMLWQVGSHDNRFAKRAPNAELTAYAADTPVAGKARITLAYNSFSKFGTADISFFNVGDIVRLLTSNLSARAGTPTIEAINVGALTVDLSTNIVGGAANDILDYAPHDTATGTGQQNHCFLCDESRSIGASTDPFKYL
jgi:hypothetical protein